MRAVPLGRRQLLSEPRRLAAAACGVGLALMLILLLDGLWAGVRSQITRYEDRQDAALYVVGPGTRNLFSDDSVLDIETLDQVRATPGVEWASPVRTRLTVIDLHGQKVPISLVGWVPGEHGGPWSMVAGRLPIRDDEVVVDKVLARRHGLRVGETVDILGTPIRVVGLSRDTAAFMTGFVFTTHRATDELFRRPRTTSAVLVGTSEPTGVRARLERQGLSVLDPGEVRAENLRLVTKVYATPLRVMVAVAFAVGTLVIALTAYATVVERRRDFGIIKAMGATPSRLARWALGQSLSLAVLGVVAGAVFFEVGRAVITAWRPQFAIVLTPSGVTRALGAAVAMAVLAALVPARRLAVLDPATAYRGA